MIVKRTLDSARHLILSNENRRRLQANLHTRRAASAVPVYFIFTPQIVHFAPYCIRDDAQGFESILLLNGVSREDEDWLRKIHPSRLIIRLMSSLTGNELSVLPHGAVLDDLFAVNDDAFCIQDPDCFVISPDFWKTVSLDPSKEMASGPFVKFPTNHDHVLPDTFFVLFNAGLFAQLSSRYRISANGTAKLGQKALRKISVLGYGRREFPEQFKNSFDTLQAFWILALAEGYKFSILPGAGETIFHVGGTSYLHNTTLDLTHWDYWPLSVIFFNLALLEREHCTRFRGRFAHILDKYQSPENLLSMHPEFCSSRRYSEMVRLLSHLSN